MLNASLSVLKKTKWPRNPRKDIIHRKDAKNAEKIFKLTTVKQRMLNPAQRSSVHSSIGFRIQAFFTFYLSVFSVDSVAIQSGFIWGNART